MEVRGQLHAPVSLPPDKRLGGPQSWSGRCTEETNLFTLPGNEPRFLNPSPRSLVTILTELFWLLNVNIELIVDIV
jgi:hypothetical protein